MKKEEEKNVDRQEPQLYELGFHIIPTVAEEALSEEVAVLTKAVTSQGGTIESQETPQLQDLAYSISKVLSNTNKVFDTAYFGWMTFTMTPEGVVALKETLDSNLNILRYLLIKTVTPETPPAPTGKMAFIKKEKKDDRVSDTTASDDENTSGEDVSEKELDKTLEELVAE